MNFLPIALRELQVTARKSMTYYWRSLGALNAACITLGCLLIGFSGALSASTAGEMTFQMLSCIGYAIAAVAAALATSDSISEERRDGTLGFLFLTDLKGYDIVMGKLARLSTPVYCLIATFPALGFSMLLGGVTLGDFAKVALALVNTLFFFSALGLLVSARCWHGRAAVSAAMMGVTIFSAPPAAALAGLHFSGAGMALLVPTPAGAFLAALEPVWTTVSEPNFFLSLAVSHALGWVFIAAASRVVARNFSREEPPPVARPREIGGPNPSLALHAGIMARKPWRPVWLLAAWVASIVLTIALISPTNWYDIPTFAGIVLGLHLILKFWTAHSACRSLASRRQSGELEMLLTTPLDGDAILLGSTTAIKHQLLRPFLFVVALDLLMLILGWHKLGIWDGFPYAAAMLLEFLWFVGNLYTLTWVGLWMGLKTSSHTKALGRTLICILFLPWSALAVAATFVGILTMGKILNPLISALTVAEFLVVALATCNLGFAGWAVSELRDRFRPLASNQPLPLDGYAPIFEKPRFWRWKRAPQAA
jgi:hypothetical protein